jgi:hypothetical protein
VRAAEKVVPLGSEVTWCKCAVVLKTGGLVSLVRKGEGGGNERAGRITRHLVFLRILLDDANSAI